jgi:NAD(P)-dependent dehydrogenase (short-subunit alcohol dehydrogenase family)
LERFGHVDVVVNNVGVVAPGSPESLPLEAWRRLLDLNLLTVARSNQGFLPLLLDTPGGHPVGRGGGGAIEPSRVVSSSCARQASSRWKRWSGSFKSRPAM